MTIRRHLLGFLTLTACVARVSPVSADDVGVTSARLLELAEGGYALEADASPALLPLLRPPVFPERFTAAPPSYRQVGITLLVRYEFGGSDVPLQSGDVLLLPWGRSAVLLTARWTDGTVQRGMFPRSPAGIRVPIEALKPVEHSALAVARRHHGAGLEGLGSRSGAYSTRSKPITLLSAHSRRTSGNASRGVSPPGSGVPVPAA